MSRCDMKFCLPAASLYGNIMFAQLQLRPSRLPKHQQAHGKRASRRYAVVFKPWSNLPVAR